jgi:hypothetical protein
MKSPRCRGAGPRRNHHRNSNGGLSTRYTARRLDDGRLHKRIVPSSPGTRHGGAVSVQFRTAESDGIVERDFVVHEINLGEKNEEQYDSMESKLVQKGAYNIVKEIQKLFVPRGWPESVSEDYLTYQLWTFPSHVFGWMSHSLAGSSMLKALGVGGGPASSVGLSAAIKWVTKDGIGAAGRLFVGGKLGFMFDEDPKRWRMIAEAFTTLGLSLEIATQISPNNFVILAGGGTVAKALGAGIGRPCFRVIQTHFALSNNIGDVSAKEEVWETSAQLVGIAASVLLLSVLETFQIPEAVVPSWFAVQAIHVATRYYSLKTLCFPWPNFKRGATLSSAYISTGAVPRVKDVSYIEDMFEAPTHLVQGTPCIFGSTWADAIGNKSTSEIQDLIKLYQDEKYVLTIDKDGAIRVVLWVAAAGTDLMRALLQASWIDQHKTSQDPFIVSSSYLYMQQTFADFETRATESGWNFEKSIFPLEHDTRIQRLETIKQNKE